jgi:hypothetical protein
MVWFGTNWLKVIEIMSQAWSPSIAIPNLRGNPRHISGGGTYLLIATDAVKCLSRLGDCEQAISTVRLVAVSRCFQTAFVDAAREG